MARGTSGIVPASTTAVAAPATTMMGSSRNIRSQSRSHPASTARPSTRQSQTPAPRARAVMEKERLNHEPSSVALSRVSAFQCIQITPCASKAPRKTMHRPLSRRRSTGIITRPIHPAVSKTTG